MRTMCSSIGLSLSEHHLGQNGSEIVVNHPFSSPEPSLDLVMSPRIALVAAAAPADIMDMVPQGNFHIHSPY